MMREHNILDKILRWVPGYEGYAACDERRRTDARLRERLYDSLCDCEKLINERITDQLKAGEYKTAEELESCRKRLHTLTEKVRFAPEGASGFMSEAPISEKELQKLIEQDFALMAVAVELESYSERLSSHDLMTVIKRMGQMMEDRNRFLKELK